MIKFSWKKINDKLDWNAFSVLEYFYLKRDIEIPPFLYRKVPLKVRKLAMEPTIKGPCFLINIDAALSNAEYPNEIYNYIELASKRNVFDYHIRGVLYLPTVLAEEYHLSLAETNSMLEVKDDKIYFKYEQE